MIELAFLIFSSFLHVYAFILCLFSIKRKHNDMKKITPFGVFYSVLKASTGSFFDADLAGINPPISVKITLKMTRIIALSMLR